MKFTCTTHIEDDREVGHTIHLDGTSWPESEAILSFPEKWQCFAAAKILNDLQRNEGLYRTLLISYGIGPADPSLTPIIRAMFPIGDLFDYNHSSGVSDWKHRVVMQPHGGGMIEIVTFREDTQAKHLVVALNAAKHDPKIIVPLLASHHIAPDSFKMTEIIRELQRAKDLAR